MSNIGKAQIGAIETLYKIFTKAADDGKSKTDPPYKRAENTAARSIPQTPHPGRPEYTQIPQPNVIKNEEGLRPANFQHKIHRSPSGPHTIPPEVTRPSPRVNTKQAPRADMGGPSSNLRSRRNKLVQPRYALTAQGQTPRGENSVTHQVSGVAQEYRHLIKGPERKVWERSFANKLGQLSQGIREVKGTNTVIFILKPKVPKDKKVTYDKIVCEINPEKEEK